MPENSAAAGFALPPLDSGLPARLANLSRPLVWVFTGDNYRRPSSLKESAVVAPLSGLAGLILREQFDRSTDAFVDSTGPALRTADLSGEFSARIGQFHPQIVVLSVSPAEASRGLDGLQRFERNLIALNRKVAEAGGHLILQTPPCLDDQSSSEAVDLLVYVEAVRGISAEQSIPLIDHWTHWETSGTRTIADHHWLDAHRSLTAAGMRELLKCFLRELPFPERIRQSKPASQRVARV
jgi:hypothetical protein